MTGQAQVDAIPIESALLVLAPAADPVAEPHRRLYDNAARAGVPAHITVDYPFNPNLDAADIASLATLFACASGFTAVFSSIGWFRQDVVFLSPVDPCPFATLATAVGDAFPDWPIYGGAFDAYVPHLTLGHDQPVATLSAVETAVAKHLPIAQPVAAVDLWRGPALHGNAGRSTGRWRRITSFPLGPAA